MSWLFKPKLSPEVTVIIRRLTDELDSLLQREARALRALGLPGACEVSPLRFSDGAQTRSELRIILPCFEIPPYRAFSMLESERKTIHPDLEDDRCYILRDNETVLAKAEGLFEAEGLSAVIEDFPGGVWTNRDPYGVYKYLTGREGTGYDDEIILPSGWGVSPLFQLTGEAMRRMVGDLPARLELFAHAAADLADDMSGMEIEEMSFIFSWARMHPERPANVPGWLYRNIIEPLQVPNTCCPALAESVTFKVLPDGASSIRQAAGLLEAIHSLAQPVLFSVIQEYGRVSFAITLHRKGADEFRRQLSLHYPNFIADELDRPPAPFDDEPQMYDLRPANPYEPGRGLSDLTIDPLQHLLSALDATPDEPVLFEAACAPIGERATATLARFFTQWHEQHGNKEAGRRGRLIAGKAPAWAVRLTLATASAETLSPLYETFLKPISTYEQPHLFARSEGRGLPLWGLVSTPELASYFHFPLFDPRRTRIEGATKTGQPPKEYVIE